MPEENKNQSGAQNKLGELFVEFSTKGLPSLLKNLNSVQAKFLLGKKAAEEFINVVTKPFKDAGNNAVGIGKISAMLGASKMDIQKLQYYLESKRLNPALIEDIAKTQQMYSLYKGGQGGMSEGFLTAMNKLGLDWMKYNESYESQLQLAQDIFNRQSRLSPVERTTNYGLLGMSPEWSYANERGDFNLKDAMAISDKAVEDNIRAAEAMAEASVAFKQTANMLISKFAPALEHSADVITTGAQKAVDLENKIDTGIKKGLEASPKKDSDIVNGLYAFSATMADVGGGIVDKKIKDAWAPILKKGETTGQASSFDLSTPIKIPIYDAPKQIGGDNAGYLGNLPDLTPPAMRTQTAVTPPDMSNISQTITITNQNNITGNNAQEIANEIAQINVQDIQYTQYQLQNLTGI